MATGLRAIEIVGVAGSGKSTLALALREGHTGYRIADSLHTRLPAHWPYVVHSIPGLLPLIGRPVRDRPLLSWEELKFIIYVLEWNRFLSAQSCDSSVTVLDQGPIFALARLLWGDKPATRTQGFHDWVEEMIGKWSQDLEVVVRLVAPGDVLLERINHRAQDHEAKGRSRKESIEILMSHQKAYESLFELIDRFGEPPILTFDTNAMLPPDIADALVGAVGGSSERQLTDARRGE